MPLDEPPDAAGVLLRERPQPSVRSSVVGRGSAAVARDPEDHDARDQEAAIQASPLRPQRGPREQDGACDRERGRARSAATGGRVAGAAPRVAIESGLHLAAGMTSAAAA